MTGPLLSIIVPVYNTAPWLRRCLDSIISQSYDNLEILCVNDGSTDNSANILAEYAAKDERVKVISQLNAGLSAARNTGLRHATGEWVTGVDSDDYLYPGIYEEVVKHCQNGINMVFFGVREEDDLGKALPDRPYFALPQPGDYKLTPELARKLNVCFVSKLWRRSILLENNLLFPVGLVHEDEALFWTAAPYIQRISICPALGYAYLQRNGSIMNQSGLDPLKRKQRLMPILEFVHAEYQKRQLLQTEAQRFLIFMFIQKCTDQASQESEACRQLITQELEKCGMKYAHYYLERLFSVEKKGIFTIRRYKCKKQYTLAGFPIWIKYYTHSGRPFSLRVICYHIKKHLVHFVQHLKNRLLPHSHNS